MGRRGIGVIDTYVYVYVYVYGIYWGFSFLIPQGAGRSSFWSGLVWLRCGLPNPASPSSSPNKSAKEDVIIKNGCFSGENNHSRLLTVHN